MDAAHILLKKTVFLLPLALFAIAPVIHAQPQFVAISTQTITSTGGLNVNVASSVPATPITFTASIDPGTQTVPAGDPTNWVSVFASGPTPGFVTLTPVNLGINQGTYTAVVRLTATSPAGVSDIVFAASFSSATGGGGGGQTGTIVATPSTVALTAIAGNQVSTQVVLSTASATAVGFSVTPNQTWLSAQETAGTVSSTAPVTLTVIANAASLVSNTLAYSGNVTVTPVGGTATIIPVAFTVSGGGGAGTLTAAPNPVSMSFTTGSGLFPQAQTVALVSTTNALTYTATPSSSNGWLLVNGSSSTVPGNIADGLTVSVSGAINLLTTGDTGTIQVLDSNNATVTIQVNLTVNGVGTGSGGGGSSLSVAPASLVFTYQTGTSTSLVSRQTVAFTGAPGALWTTTVTTTDNGGWLALSTILGGLQGDGTGTTTVIINPSALVPGTYHGNVAITFSATSTTQNVGVTLTVQGSPILVPVPGSVVFNFHTGDAALQPQQIFLNASDGSAVSATAAAATDTPWITVSPQTASGAFLFSANPAGMATGLYSGSVTVTQDGLANSPLTVPVVLIVNGGSGTGGGGGGPLTFSQNSLLFSALAGSNPNPQLLTVSAATATNFTVTTSVPNGGSNWLNVNSTTGTSTLTTNTNVTVSVNSAFLQVGSYSGTITFAANGVNQTVAVTLNVTTLGGGGGNVTATPALLSFSGQAGAGSLAGQTLTINAQGALPVNFTLTTATTGGGGWLSTSAQSGGTFSTQLLVTVNVNVTGLGAGTYNGSIIITPTGGNVVTVPVTLTVATPLTVSATPTALTFTYRAGDPTPASQSVSVTGGGASLAFTATASSSGNWLVVAPGSGTTPAPLTVSLSPANLANLNASPTPYTGTITVLGSGTATGSTTITVSLTVTAPLPTVTAVTNAGSFLTGSISPGEIVTLFGTGIGPAAQAVLALDTTGKVATTIGGVQVTVNGFNCPMVFASATQISAVVPYEVAGFATADVLVKFLGQTSNAVHVNVATTAPGLFTQNASGKGPGAILNSNNSLNSPNIPAAKGDIVAVYMTGEGQTNPKGVTGKVTTVSTTPPLTPAPLLLVSVLIGPPGAQQSANFTFAGEAPGLVSGAMQLNVQIPTTAASGDQPIVVSIGGNPSQPGVTVSVK